ncbi:MAG: glycosyl hydrolase [Pseudomonadota bacterium]
MSLAYFTCFLSRAKHLPWNARSGRMAGLFAATLLIAALRQAPEAWSVDKPPVPETGVYVGAHLFKDQTRIYEFNRLTGIRHAIYGEFIKFPEVLGQGGSAEEKQKLLDFVEKCRSAGALPLITLETFGGLSSFTVQEEADFAELIGGLEIPVFLRWNHEMNGSWYPWGQQPTLYINRFREFAQIIRQQASNAALVWTPNQGWGYPWPGGAHEIQPGDPDFALLDSNDDGTLTEEDDPYGPYYPGDAYVDWVGFSFYHWSNDPQKRGANEVPYPEKWAQANGLGQGIPNFHDVFALGRGKPMIIAETSALYDPTDSLGGGASEWNIKSMWIKEVYNLTDPAIARIDQAFPMLKAVCWFNQQKYESEVSADIDWRLNSNPALLEFYRQTLSDEYFKKAILEFERVAIIQAPDTVFPGGKYLLEIEYQALERRDILVNLLNTENDFEWHGGFAITVEPGSGRIDAEIEVDDAPAGTGFVWDAILVPSGQDWTQTLDKEQKNVTVEQSPPLLPWGGASGGKDGGGCFIGVLDRG